MTFKTNISANPRTFIVAKGGDDVQSGQSFETAFLTLSRAQAAVDALVPPSDIDNPSAILTSGAGNFQESITLPDGCQFDGENIINFPLIGDAFAPASQASFEILSAGVVGSNATVFTINNKSQVGVVSKAVVVLGTNGKGVHVLGTSDDIFITISQLELNGSGSVGILDETTDGAPEVYNINELTLKANNTCGFRHNPTSDTSEAILNAGLIGEVGSFTGTKGVEVLNGILDAFVNTVEAVDAIIVSNSSTLNIVSDHIIGNITVDVGCTLNCEILDFTGTVTNNGTIIGRIGSVNFPSIGATPTIIDFSPGLETTSGSTPIAKASIVIPAVDATFIIEGTAMVSFSNVDGHPATRLFNRTDLVPLGRQWEEEMEDNNDILSTVFRQEFVQTIAAGAKTIELQYFIQQGSGTLSISDGLLTANEVISV